MNNEKILIIEDDADIREGIRILLESEDWTVMEADCGEKGLEMLTDDISLVILDVMMPGISGIKTCEEIRKSSVVPILFLTAKSSESDKLIGLMAGGDDYLSKPFSFAELLGRVKALVRRYKTYNPVRKVASEPVNTQSGDIIEVGEIRLNKAFNEVYVGEEPVNLSEIEYQILRLLMENPKRTFSAQNIYENIWNEPYFYTSNSTVMVHIRKLRVKIEKSPETPEHIKTVWGKGYRFE